ncbi:MULTISPECIES: hypothetical protein [unclassified Nocardia]|uniref:hypothetical protein n=1 Tax=unclassified Nocardia TaxID=2637762 RepID=UPI00278BCFA1|nr:MULTISPECIES: hypothetical protein [unclassified Nocardia]
MSEPSAATERSVHEQMHLAALAACPTKKERIHYACEQLGNPRTAEVIAWLKRHGETVSRPNTATVVNEWKRERGLADTGALPKLSDELLAELDSARSNTPAASPDPARANIPAADTPVFDTDTEPSADSVDTSNEHPGPSTEHRPLDDAPLSDPPEVFEVFDTAVAAEPRTPDTNTEHVADADTEHEQGNGHMRVAIADTETDIANEQRADTDATPAGQPFYDTPVVYAPATGPSVATATAEDTANKTPPGAAAFYVVALLSLLVSLDTSWLFFKDNLGIENVWIRSGMFAVLEAALIACGIGMAVSVRRSHTPGSAQLTAWILCGFAGYMAVIVDGPVLGLARVGLGPILGMVMLHHALGIEKRARREHTGVWARIGREMRERMLSRLGLADDERDAARRTADRAARRVAKLSLSKRVWFREARLARALAAANVAHDPQMRSVMLAELATRRHAGELATLAQTSPWAEHPAA